MDNFTRELFNNAELTMELLRVRVEQLERENKGRDLEPDVFAIERGLAVACENRARVAFTYGLERRCGVAVEIKPAKIRGEQLFLMWDDKREGAIRSFRIKRMEDVWIGGQAEATIDIPTAPPDNGLAAELVDDIGATLGVDTADVGSAAFDEAVKIAEKVLERVRS